MASPVRQVAGQYANIATATTTQVKSGRGVLQQIIINGGTLGAITVADAIAGTTPAIATIGATAPIGTTLHYGIEFRTGLRIVTAAATDITVVYE